MSAIIITGALARHFKEQVAGTKEAYATGVTGQAAPSIPSDIFDTPVVLTMYRAVQVTPGSFERTHWIIDALAYFGGADTAAAYQIYVAYVDAVRTSIRLNWDLYGTATQVSSWTAEDPEDVEVKGKKYVRISFTFDILEAGPQTYGKLSA